MAVVYAVVDRVVDDYAPVVDGLENDVDEIESEVFGRARHVSRRTYELIREVIEFRRAVNPLPEVLLHLMRTETSATRSGPIYGTCTTMRCEFRSRSTVSRAPAQHPQHQLTLETKALNEAGNRQNEEVKKISAWAAILFAPTSWERCTA